MTKIKRNFFDENVLKKPFEKEQLTKNNEIIDSKKLPKMLKNGNKLQTVKITVIITALNTPNSMASENRANEKRETIF